MNIYLYKYMRLGDKMIISCENYFCIYEKDGKCVLEEVEIDAHGVCGDCVYPCVDFEKLEQIKENYRKNY